MGGELYCYNLITPWVSDPFKNGASEMHMAQGHRQNSSALSFWVTEFSIVWRKIIADEIQGVLLVFPEIARAHNIHR